MRLGRVGAIVLVVVSVAWAMPARADDNLEQARKAVDQSDYLAARTSLDKALASGSMSPGDLADVYKLSGIVEAALGNTKDAQVAFGKWLALDPKAELPPGTSPKITRPFSAAEADAKKHDPLKLKTETTSEPPSVTLVVVSDPLHLVAKARVFVSADHKPEVTLDGSGTDKIKVDLPKGKRLDLRVIALDERGNHVAELGSTDVPIVITGAGAAEPDHHEDVVVVKKPPPPPEEVHPRPLWAKWWLWGSVAVAIGGAGTYFGIEARSERDQLAKLNADSQNHTFSEAQSVESSARRDVLLFNIGAIAGGAIALGAVVLYLTEPHARHTETQIGAVPLQGGGAVVLGGHF